MFLKITTESQQNPPESAINSEHDSPILDKSGNPITGVFLDEVKRLQNLSSRTAAERLRLHALLKYGNAAQPALIAPKANKEQPDSLKCINESLGELKQPADDHRTISNIIRQIEDGNDILKAIKSQNIRPSKFYKLLEKSEFQKEKNEFLQARTILADYYLYKVNQLQEWLLAGKIDNCTYSNLSRDALYLAGKLAPQAYGDKIQIESKSISATVHRVDSDSFRRLNELLNGGTGVRVKDGESIPQITDESGESD